MIVLALSKLNGFRTFNETKISQLKLEVTYQIALRFFGTFSQKFVVSFRLVLDIFFSVGISTRS